MYSLDKYVQHNTWWYDIDVGYNRYTHTFLKVRI